MDEREVDRLLKHLARAGPADKTFRETCPDADHIAALVDGRALDEERRVIEEHARRCERCSGALEALRRSPVPRRRRLYRTAMWASLAAAAGIVISVWLLDPFRWRAGGEMRVGTDGPALVLAARGDVRDGDRSLAYGDEVSAGATIRLASGAGVTLLARDRIVQRGPDGQLEEIDASVAWTGASERSRSLELIRNSVRRSAETEQPLRIVAPIGAIADPKPTFRWEGGDGPVSILVREASKTWSLVDVSGHELAYPSEWPPLEVGGSILWQVTAGPETASATYRLLAPSEADRMQSALQRGTEAVRRTASGDAAERAVSFFTIECLRKSERFDEADAEAKAACDRFPEDRLLLEEWALVRHDMGDEVGAKALARRAAARTPRTH